MPTVKLEATGAVPQTLELSKQGDTEVRFESDLEGWEVTFAENSPFAEARIAGERAAAKSLKSDVAEGRYSYSYTWKSGMRDKPTRMADIDITR